MSRHLNEKIREFILANVEKNPNKIGALTTKEFRISRGTASAYLQRLIGEGILEAEGNGRSKKFDFRILSRFEETIPITLGLKEDVVWRTQIAPCFDGVRENIRDICNYGFTEILNNAIEHSEGSFVKIQVQRKYNQIMMWIEDNGVGIFEKIKRDFNLEDRQHAILELSKGKLTSDGGRHTGEGIFFTSRMFPMFEIRSLDLQLIRTKIEGNHWLFEADKPGQHLLGTCVTMVIDCDVNYTPDSIFAKYTDDNSRFSKTYIDMKLAKYEGEQLVSRSQAKRILNRLDRFTEVVLNFAGISTIGQAFADEIFRVYKTEHPDIHMYPIHASASVRQMIEHATANASVGAALLSSVSSKPSLNSLAEQILDSSETSVGEAKKESSSE